MEMSNMSKKRGRLDRRQRKKVEIHKKQEQAGRQPSIKKKSKVIIKKM
jgi:hypothetical protein